MMIILKQCQVLVGKHILFRYSFWHAFNPAWAVVYQCFCRVVHVAKAAMSTQHHSKHVTWLSWDLTNKIGANQKGEFELLKQWKPFGEHGLVAYRFCLLQDCSVARAVFQGTEVANRSNQMKCGMLDPRGRPFFFGIKH